MNIKEEIIKRKENENDAYSLLGAEIKKHRLAMAQTLSSVASDNCSVSYLCKIERNQIKASPKHLKEICEKVGISEEKTNYLLNSNDLLKEAVKSFFYKDLELQKNYLEKLKGLDNHRVILIRMVFAITRGDLKVAKAAIEKLYKLTSSLATIDLVVFATFYGIYSYMIGDYLNAADYFKVALDDTNNLEYIDAIAYKYLFLTSAIVNSPNTINHYNNLLMCSLKYGDNLKLDSIHYEMAYYYLLEENFLEYQRILKRISNPISKYSLDYIYHIRLENDKQVDISMLDELGLCYYMIYNNSKNTSEYINESKLKSEVKCHLNYLNIKRHNLEKAYEYLIEEAFPMAVKKDLYYYADFYLEEIAESIHRPNKYRRFFDMYLELKMVKKLVYQI